MAIAVGRVLFLLNHLKQGHLAVLKTDGTSGRRIHGWRKPPSKPPENLPFSPKILRRGEDESFTVIQTRVLNRFQRAGSLRGESPRADFEQEINYGKGRELFSCANSSPRFLDCGEWGRRRSGGLISIILIIMLFCCNTSVPWRISRTLE